MPHSCDPALSFSPTVPSSGTNGLSIPADCTGATTATSPDTPARRSPSDEARAPEVRPCWAGSFAERVGGSLPRAEPGLAHVEASGLARQRVHTAATDASSCQNADDGPRAVPESRLPRLSAAHPRVAGGPLRSPWGQRNGCH